MPSTQNASQRLADHLLGRPLSAYVAEKRTARPRWSWALIADQLAKDTNGEVTVTGEALRSWYRDKVAA